MSQLLVSKPTYKVVPHANADGEIDGMIVSPPRSWTDAQTFSIVFGWPDLLCHICHSGMTDRNYNDFRITMNGWECKRHQHEKKQQKALSQ